MEKLIKKVEELLKNNLQIPVDIIRELHQHGLSLKELEDSLNNG